MPVNQGLLSLNQQSPDFSNNALSSLINYASVGFTAKVKQLINKSVASDIVTNSQRSSINSALNKNSWLNIGQYLIDLNSHTNKLLTGELGEVIQEDFPATFLDHLNTVVGFENTIPNLYGVSADSLGKGIKGHFGSLSGELDLALQQLGKDVAYIDNRSLSTDAAFQSALQNLSDYIDTFGDSTDVNDTTFGNFVTAIQNASDNLASDLSTGIYIDIKARLISTRSTVREQINLEINNLSTIISYDNALLDLVNYQSLANDQGANALLVRVSQNPAWKDYFINYPARETFDNPIYNNSQSDSANAEIIDTVLRLRGLPDVTDYVDVDSVAAKSLRDTRLTGKLSDSNKTTEQIITDACVLLGISIDNKDVYAKSKSLLANMTENDREIVKRELDLHNQVNTLS